MADLEVQAALAQARQAASAASYDIQKLPEDSIERQALHNLSHRRRRDHRGARRRLSDPVASPPCVGGQTSPEPATVAGARVAA